MVHGTIVCTAKNVFIILDSCDFVICVHLGTRRIKWYLFDVHMMAGRGIALHAMRRDVPQLVAFVTSQRNSCNCCLRCRETDVNVDFFIRLVRTTVFRGVCVDAMKSAETVDFFGMMGLLLARTLRIALHSLPLCESVL